jgi:fatty acid desaturase
MIYIYGFYRFAQKQIGYRNDFCLTCKTECLAQQWRSFNCGHLFFIPILPFGVFKRWLCPICKLNPHTPPSSKGYKVLVTTLVGIIVALILLTLVLNYTSPPKPDDPPREMGAIWIMAAIFGTVFGFLVRWTMHHVPSPDLPEKLRQLKPASRDVCAYCNAKLSSEAFCEACQLQRYDVNDLRR